MEELAREEPYQEVQDLVVVETFMVDVIIDIGDVIIGLGTVDGGVGTGGGVIRIDPGIMLLFIGVEELHWELLLF